jgi:nucleoid DNA-binding protein
MAKKKKARLCRADLVKTIAANHNLTQAGAREILGDLFNAIAMTVQAGGTVTVRGFGQFLGRVGGGFERNGKVIPKRRRLAFRPSVCQKEAV